MTRDCHRSLTALIVVPKAGMADVAEARYDPSGMPHEDQNRGVAVTRATNVGNVADTVVDAG